MDFKIALHRILKNIPSASGIVVHKGSYYVIGDDTPYLFKLNAEMDTIAQYKIMASEEFGNGRIAKKDKPDFEALEMVSEEEIIGFGSGSKSPERDIFVKIRLGETLSVKQASLSGFYDALRKLEILRDSELNIEAAAFHHNVLYLFNRRKNVIFSMDYSEFLDYMEKGDSLPKIAFLEYQLPQLNGIQAGFSGATFASNGKLLVTCSVEDTDNAYDDGEVLGSFVGVATVKNGVFGPIDWVPIDTQKGTLKVESISIDREVSETEVDVVLVTDSDGGSSYILKGNLKF